jgi:hypothetical protein
MRRAIRFLIFGHISWHPVALKTTAISLTLLRRTLRTVKSRINHIILALIIRRWTFHERFAYLPLHSHFNINKINQPSQFTFSLYAFSAPVFSILNVASFLTPVFLRSSVFPWVQLPKLSTNSLSLCQSGEPRYNVHWSCSHLSLNSLSSSPNHLHVGIVIVIIDAQAHLTQRHERNINTLFYHLRLH